MTAPKPQVPQVSASRVSAIVPTLNEAAEIQRTLRSLREAGIQEIIVVDGGSTDGTVDLAEEYANVLLSQEGGLFAQLNRGATEATCDVLLFHYADVLFPPHGRLAIDHAFSSPDFIGGAFALQFTSRAPVYRWIAGGANLRNRLRLGPFGDQSIFVRREVFRALGGFDVDRFLEDLQFVQRLRHRGRFALLSSRVRASVRRWERLGVFRTLFHHWWLSTLYVLGKRYQHPAVKRRVTGLRTVR